MRLTKREKELHDAGITILETVGDEKSVISKNISTNDASNIPDKVTPKLDKYIKTIRHHEIYGSAAMKSRTYAGRTPADIDIVVKNPRQKANRIAQLMRNHNIKVKVESNPEFNSHVVQVSKHGRVWEDAVDIHPIDTHKQEFDVYGKSQAPTTINGMKVQRASDQLLRKANSVMGYNKKEGRMGAPKHRELKDVVDFITTSRLLLDSKELQAEADIAQVKVARKELNKWKKHSKTLEGDKSAIGKDPIPEHREDQFISFAKKNPKVNPDNIKLNRKGAYVKKNKTTTGVNFTGSLKINKKSKSKNKEIKLWSW